MLSQACLYWVMADLQFSISTRMLFEDETLKKSLSCAALSSLMTLKMNKYVIVTSSIANIPNVTKTFMMLLLPVYISLSR